MPAPTIIAVMVSAGRQMSVPFRNSTDQVRGDNHRPEGIAADGLKGHPAGAADVGPDGQGQVDQQECQPAGEPEDGNALGGFEQAQEFAAAENQGQADLDEEQDIGGESVWSWASVFLPFWAPAQKI